MYIYYISNLVKRYYFLTIKALNWKNIYHIHPGVQHIPAHHGRFRLASILVSKEEFSQFWAFWFLFVIRGKRLWLNKMKKWRHVNIQIIPTGRTWYSLFQTQKCSRIVVGKIVTHRYAEQVSNIFPVMFNFRFAVLVSTYYSRSFSFRVCGKEISA